MDRRQYIKTACVTASVGVLSGCSNSDGSDNRSSTPSETDRPTTRTQTNTSTEIGEPDRTLIVIGSGPLTVYEITVSGEIKQIDGTLEGRPVTKQATDDVFGSTVQGEVFDGADGFRFSGEITDISFPADPEDSPDSIPPDAENIPDPITILIDDEEWTE